MRAVLVTVGAAVILVAAACGTDGSKTVPINVYVAGKYVGAVGPTGDSQLYLRKVPTLSRGHASVTIHVSATIAKEIVARGLAASRGRVDLPFTLASSFIAIESKQQMFRHGSEVTALSGLLALDGINADQTRLMQRLPRSGPLDPQPVAGSKLFRWGDPERGFVGRPNRARGGFGVYEPPIRRLAARYRVHLIDLHGKSVAAVHAALLAGHPVLAWVGSAGKQHYSTWLTPSGKKLTVNLGEHAIVLIGVGPGYFTVNDPVTGKRATWTESQFSQRWELIGRRALALP